MKQALTAAALSALLVLAGHGADKHPNHGHTPDPAWRVVATSVGDRKIEAIKAIREVTNLGLKDAKDLAEAVPSVILSGVSQDEAEAAASKLRAAGITVQTHSE